MTQEEAIETLENHTQYFVPVQDLGALNTAISALRPVSREQVEKVWRGEWMPVGDDAFYSRCSKCGKMAVGKRLSCPNCGAPMTDEAVEMVMERLEALHETT